MVSVVHDDGVEKQRDRSVPAAVPFSLINSVVSSKLSQYANLLERQLADPFRIKAYRRAADTVIRLDRSVDNILLEEGQEGLVALPAIGKSIASVIAEIVDTGVWTQLDRLQGNVSPEALFQTIPGIGHELARQLVEEQHLESFEDLEAALHRDNLQIKGFGPGRRESISAVLEQRLGRSRLKIRFDGELNPPIDLLLKVDAMYCERAKKGTLKFITPIRFNPERKPWLPVMHASHDEWHFTAMYSNTAQAHRFHKTGDWVVIYYQADGYAEGRCTVVTETRGPMLENRVVRGRESETPLV